MRCNPCFLVATAVLAALACNRLKDGEYNLTLLTTNDVHGRFFDSTVKRNQPFEFVFGTELQVIPGLEDAIGRMREGQRALVILPSDLAWGEKGSSTGIVPPFTTVIYEVELLKAVPQSSDSEDSEDIEKQSDSTEE